MHCRIIRLAGLEKKLKVSGCLPERDEKIAPCAKNVDQEGGNKLHREDTARRRQVARHRCKARRGSVAFHRSIRPAGNLCRKPESAARF